MLDLQPIHASRARSLAGAAACALACFLAAPAFAAPARTPGALEVYFVDVEGGQATLFVSPEGKSLLIDTGWPGNGGRDADRIAAAAKDAGLSRIDYVLITHYHDDHVGGAVQLAAKIPVGAFLDHGDNREPGNEATEARWQAYKALLASGSYRRVVAQPGYTLELGSLHLLAVSSDGKVLDRALPGAGADNPDCRGFEPRADATENPRSLGSLLTFGKLRILDLGDLTADKERDLMCPSNRLGRVDVYIASHHGSMQSGSAALVHAVAPRVAVVDNGASKGGDAPALDIIRSSPGLAAMWQLHVSEAGSEHNAALEFIANLPGPDAGNYLKLTARPDGGLAIFNSRTGETRSYPAP